MTKRKKVKSTRDEIYDLFEEEIQNLTEDVMEQGSSFEDWANKFNKFFSTFKRELTDDINEEIDVQRADAQEDLKIQYWVADVSSLQDLNKMKEFVEKEKWVNLNIDDLHFQ